MKLCDLFEEEEYNIDDAMTCDDNSGANEIGNMARRDSKENLSMAGRGTNMKKASRIVGRAKLAKKDQQLSVMIRPSNMVQTSPHRTPGDSMLIEEIINTGREKAERIAARTKLKAKRMNPKATKHGNTPGAGSKPEDATSNMGGDDPGTGLMSWSMGIKPVYLSSVVKL